MNFLRHVKSIVHFAPCRCAPHASNAKSQKAHYEITKASWKWSSYLEQCRTGLERQTKSTVWNKQQGAVQRRHQNLRRKCAEMCLDPERLARTPSSPLPHQNLLTQSPIHFRPRLQGALGLKMTMCLQWPKMAGPIMDAACLTYEGVSLELEVFPRTKDDVWILGRKYNTEKGNQSRLSDAVRWFLCLDYEIRNRNGRFYM